MKKNIAFCGIFFLVLLGGMIGYFLHEQRDFSEEENRYLAGKPEFTMENVLSGDYTSSMDNYATDQFLLRNQAFGIKTQIQMLMGNKDCNGVYFCKNGSLVLKKSEYEFDEARFQKNLHAVELLAEHNSEIPVRVLLAPTAAYINQDQLPVLAIDYDQKSCLEKAEETLTSHNNVQWIPADKALLENRDGSLYYRTDHHWTSKGAYYAYTAFCKVTGLEPVAYDGEVVSSGFYGTLYSKVLGPFIKPDCIERQKDSSVDVKINYSQEKKETSSWYDEEKLQIKDQYQYFLGGNSGEITVNTSVTNGKHLLVVKDSYANCFLPFLTSHYESIHIVDLRFYNQSLNQYINQNGINEVLVLYNLNNFDEDTSIVKMQLP